VRYSEVFSERVNTNIEVDTGHLESVISYEILVTISYCYLMHTK